MSDVTPAMPITATGLGAALAALWCDCGCSWRMEFDEDATMPWPWAVVMEWANDYPDHNADFVVYTWRFPSETVEEALTDAVAWCEALVPFRPCSGCDGAGEYGLPDARLTCEDCGGSGLDSDVKAQS